MPGPRLAKTSDREAELILYGVVDRWGDINPREVRDQLKALGPLDTLHVHLNSEGGSIFAGLAVYNTLLLDAARVIVHVDGIALSMASVIAMAGDEIVMAEGAMLMIHNPLWMAAGEAEELRQTADVMDKLKDQLVAIYARRTGKPPEEISAWMDAETWLTGDEAIAAGFADRTEARLAIAAALDPAKFVNLPKHLVQASTPNSQLPTPNKEPSMAENTPPATPQTPQPANYHELKAAFPKADATFLASQLDAQATLDQARAAWQMALEKRAADAEARAQELQAKAEEAANAAGTLGSAGLPDGLTPGGDRGDALDFRVLVDNLVAQGMARHLAARQVAKRYPEARAAYVARHNEEHAYARQ